MQSVSKYFNGSCTLANAGKERLASYFKPVSAYAESYFSDEVKKTFSQNRSLVIAAFTFATLSVTGLAIYFLFQKYASNSAIDNKNQNAQLVIQCKNNKISVSPTGFSLKLPAETKTNTNLVFKLSDGLTLEFSVSKTEKTIGDYIQEFMSNANAGLEKHPITVNGKKRTSYAGESIPQLAKLNGIQFVERRPKKVPDGEFVWMFYFVGAGHLHLLKFSHETEKDLSKLKASQEIFKSIQFTEKS